MVKHILFVKMKDNSIEQCEKVKALFLSMKEQIPFCLLYTSSIVCFSSAEGTTVPFSIWLKYVRLIPQATASFLCVTPYSSRFCLNSSIKFLSFILQFLQSKKATTIFDNCLYLNFRKRKDNQFLV